MLARQDDVETAVPAGGHEHQHGENHAEQAHGAQIVFGNDAGDDGHTEKGDEAYGQGAGHIP
jgi:hypothetical protein